MDMDMDMDHMHNNMTNCTDGDMMNMTMDMDMMKMYFHTGYESHILIEKWTAQSDAAVFGWCAFFFFLAIGYELLKYFRHIHLQRAQTRTVCVSGENGAAEGVSSSTATQETTDSHIGSGDKYDRPLHRRSMVERQEIKMLSIVHLVQTVLHVIQIFVSYILMLAFMLFNVWLCLAVVLGAGVGYFLVGSRRHTTYSALDDDHCH